MKHPIVFSLLLLMLLAAMAPAARACGMVYPAGAQAAITEEDALIIWEPQSQTQTLIRRSRFATDQPSLGFLVPTPSQPSLSEADDAVFQTLTAAIQPRVRHTWFFSLVQAILAPTFIGAQSSAEKIPDPAQVQVLDQQQLGPYQASVLKATDADALSAWLQQHNYPLRPGLKDWLETYTREGWFLTAFQLNQSPQKALSLPAVSLRFQTVRPFYPYTEPADSPAREGRQLRLFMLSPGPMQSLYDSLNPEIYDGFINHSYGNALGTEGRSFKLYAAPLSPAQQQPLNDRLQLSTEGLWLSAWLDESSQRPHGLSATDSTEASSGASPEANPNAGGELAAPAGSGPAELYFYPNRAGKHLPLPREGWLIFIPLDVLALLYVWYRYRRRVARRRASA